MITVFSLQELIEVLADEVDQSSRTNAQLTEYGAIVGDYIVLVRGDVNLSVYLVIYHIDDLDRENPLLRFAVPRFKSAKYLQAVLEIWRYCKK